MTSSERERPFSRRTRATVVVALVLALLGAGCSSGSGGSTDTAGSGGERSATTAATARAKAVQFAECMRDNGVREFPDPDASGELTIDAVANGSSLDTDSAAFTQAISACKDLEPSGFTGHKRSTQQQEAALEFAQCMRDNGVKDFPDPTPDSPLIDTTRIPSMAGKDPRSDPGLNAAMQRCGDAAAGAGVRRP